MVTTSLNLTFTTKLLRRLWPSCDPLDAYCGHGQPCAWKSWTLPDSSRTGSPRGQSASPWCGWRQFVDWRIPCCRRCSNACPCPSSPRPAASPSHRILPGRDLEPRRFLVETFLHERSLRLLKLASSSEPKGSAITQADSVRKSSRHFHVHTTTSRAENSAQAVPMDFYKSPKTWTYNEGNWRMSWSYLVLEAVSSTRVESDSTLQLKISLHPEELHGYT